MTTTHPVKRKRRMKPRTRAILTAFIMGALSGIVLVLSIQPTRVVYVREVPTQSTAVVTKAYTSPMVTTTTEDSRGWDCRKSGNHICGPGNPQHVKPGLYKNGRMVVTWYELKTWGVWQYGPPANAR